MVVREEMISHNNRVVSHLISATAKAEVIIFVSW